MSATEKEFIVRNIEDSILYYLGSNMKQVFEKYWHTSPIKYVEETLEKYQKEHDQINKKPIPLSPSVHPEIEKSSKY